MVAGGFTLSSFWPQKYYFIQGKDCPETEVYVIQSMNESNQRPPPKRSIEFLQVAFEGCLPNEMMTAILLVKCLNSDLPELQKLGNDVLLLFSHTLANSLTPEQRPPTKPDLLAATKFLLAFGI